MGAETDIIAGRYFHIEGNLFVVRRYDPKFLTILGSLQDLRNLSVEEARAGKLHRAWLLIHQFVLDRQNEFGLKKTVDAANMLLAWMNPIIEDKKYSWLEEFPSLLNILKNFLDSFESALGYDMDALHVYVLEQKRGYAVETLLRGIVDCLPIDDRTLVPEFARENLQEAGACLVFERFTACGYHMGRAVEDVVRRYYQAVTGREPEMKTLGALATELGHVWQKRKNAPSGLLPPIVPTLEQFCRIFRNPLAHTGDIKLLSESEADVAFGHAINLIATILEDIRKGGPHFSQPEKIQELFPGSQALED